MTFDPSISRLPSVVRALWRALLSVIAGGSLLAVTACGESPASQPMAEKVENGVALSNPALQYLTIEPVGQTDADMAAQVFPGRLAMRPQALASIGVSAAGRVASVRVRPGERIAAGTVLVTIQSPDAAAARASLEQASARAAAAEDALHRQSEMMAKGVGLEVERFAAETAAREARAELERARRAVELIGAGTGDIVSVKAPNAGVVMTVKTSVGAMVSPGAEPVVEIADASRLWLVADVPETEAASVIKGQRVNVFVSSQNLRLEAVVDGLGSEVDAQTRRLPVYVALQGDVGTLTPGMQAEMRFAAESQSALVLPVEAVLIKDGKHSIVYVQQPDGRFVPRDVRTGISKGGMVTILDGLRRGERVVVKGALLLDGEAEQLL